MRLKLFLLLSLSIFIHCFRPNKFESYFKKSMEGKEGAIVVLDLSSNEEYIYNLELATIRTTPCSTFKIWNTLIGLETNTIHSEFDSFYVWDGVQREYKDWNRDLNLEEAFRVSCVPAYQNLARKIGMTKMKSQLEKIQYGDLDLSSGVDEFWLSRPGKKSIQISPYEQAFLIKKFMNQDLKFSDSSRQVLEKIMLYKTSEKASLYGKTGSGKDPDGIAERNIGWYVGYISGQRGRYSFACLLRGANVSGKTARDLMEELFIESGYL